MIPACDGPNERTPKGKPSACLFVVRAYPFCEWAEGDKAHTADLRATSFGNDMPTGSYTPPPPLPLIRHDPSAPSGLSYYSHSSTEILQHELAEVSTK